MRPYDKKSNQSKNQIISGIGKALWNSRISSTRCWRSDRNRKSPFAQEYSKNCFRQESLMDLKLLEQRMEKWNFLPKVKDLPRRHLFMAKRKSIKVSKDKGRLRNCPRLKIKETKN